MEPDRRPWMGVFSYGMGVAMSEHDQINGEQVDGGQADKAGSEGAGATEYSRREALMAVRKYALGTSVVVLTASKAVTEAAASTGGQPNQGGGGECNPLTPGFPNC